MSKRKLELHFSGFKELAERLDELGRDLKPITEKALIESHMAVTPAIEKAIQKPNLPSGGKYSTGATQKSIIKTPVVNWEGSIGSIDIGFDISKAMTSIFLMYGTPRHKPVSGLYEAIYGNKTKKEISKIQKVIFEKAIKNAMEGK